MDGDSFFGSSDVSHTKLPQISTSGFQYLLQINNETNYHGDTVTIMQCIGEQLGGVSKQLKTLKEVRKHIGVPTIDRFMLSASLTSSPTI